MRVLLPALAILALAALVLVCVPDDGDAYSFEVEREHVQVFIKKDEACRKFVFASKVQLHHINGLTYDFLYGIAKELEEKDSLMALGAGPKSNQPLILRRGGSPYRGFLEGRTDGDKYCLILHFSNLELKAPKEESSDE